MSDFIEIKKAISTLRKVGCTSITVDRIKFRKSLCEYAWPMPTDDVKNGWWIHNGTDVIRIFGVDIKELTNDKNQD